MKPAEITIKYAKPGQTLEDLASLEDPFHPYHWQYRDRRFIGEVELRGAIPVLNTPLVDLHMALLKHPEWIRW